MANDIDDIKKTVEHAYDIKSEDLVWKPIYPNNLIDNGIIGYYALLLIHHNNGRVNGRKYSIIFQRKEEEKGTGRITKEIECYILFEKVLGEIKGPLDYPDPRKSDPGCLWNTDITLHDGGVNDYGRFVWAYWNIEDAKKRALVQFRAIYGYVLSHLIPPDDSQC